MIEHQRHHFNRSLVIRQLPMIGNMAQQSHSSCVGKYGSKPDFVLGGRASASAECRHWPGRAVRWFDFAQRAALHAVATSSAGVGAAESRTAEPAGARGASAD
jgi:hypothetical protein